jgi:hypothetical protein
MRFPADQLEALLDGHDAFDLRPTDQRFERLMRPLVADCADYRPFHSPHDMRSVAELPNLT